jgi:hypothetical protein
MIPLGTRFTSPVPRTDRPGRKTTRVYAAVASQIRSAPSGVLTIDQFAAKGLNRDTVRVMLRVMSKKGEIECVQAGTRHIMPIYRKP